MKRSRFTEEQIIAILREQEAGVATAELCRKHGVSSATFYAWKAKYGGLDVSHPAIAALFPRGGRAFLVGTERLFSFALAEMRAATS